MIRAVGNAFSTRSRISPALGAKAPIPQPNEIMDKSVVNPNRFEKAGTNPDVIFAFFGYNESFAGEAGLPKFKTDLEAWIKHTQSQKYNGKSAPKIVLFSPIAFEDHKSPNLPTGEAVERVNKNLELYTKAMGEVAAANGVHFVDLFEPMTFRYTAAALKKQKPLTINGAHLNEEGYRKLAEVIDQRLFPAEGAYAPPDEKLMEKLRPREGQGVPLVSAVPRTTASPPTAGARGPVPATDGQSNYEVVEELEVPTS